MNSFAKMGITSNRSIYFVAVISSILLCFILLQQKEEYKVIASDGVGYYSYLPHTFLTQSIGNQSPDGRYYKEVNGKGVNKYYVGTAVSMAPFFGLGAILGAARGEQNEPFSFSYQVAISLAGICYLLGGLFFFRGTLKLFQFPDSVISVVILLLFFGTNLLVYSILEPSMSHIYSFFWISGFIFWIKSYVHSMREVQLYAAAFFLAMVILVRPLNGVILFALPFLLGSTENLGKFVSSVFFKKRLWISLFIGLVVLFIQSVFWYVQSGYWLVWSYANEGFEFGNPYWREFLFSFRKGALVYTPILLFSLAGVWVLLRKKKYQGFSALLFSVGLVYLLSSWWNWYYGPSFGQRPLVDFLSFSGILMAYFFTQLSSKSLKWISGVFVVLFLVLNLIQSYQYQFRILSVWDMSWEKYQYSFLKTNPKHQNSLGGNNDIMLYNADPKQVYSVRLDFEQHAVDSAAHSIAQSDSYFDYQEKEFGVEHSIQVREEMVTSRGIYILVDLQLLNLEISHKNEALFVVDIMDEEGKNYHYYTFPIRAIPPSVIGEWKKETYQIEVPQLHKIGDRIKVYIWNKTNEKFLVDSLRLKVLAIE